jgi:starch synthase (maltosyl-transferring)
LRVFADAANIIRSRNGAKTFRIRSSRPAARTGSGDAYSPGWFELPLAKGASVTLVAHGGIPESPIPPGKKSGAPGFFRAQLERAAKQFVVRRDEGQDGHRRLSVVSGLGPRLADLRARPAGGRHGGRGQTILLTFAKFEKDGTLPNTIHGNDVSNRDTSDAPLWFAVVCEDLADGSKFFDTRVDDRRTIRDVLASIAENYSAGTPNGIRMDADSALIWSPSHFTWMDTNYPAGTPREGYPVEIQALWIRLLRLLENPTPAEQKKWRDLADHALASFEKLFWLEPNGLVCRRAAGRPARHRARCHGERRAAQQLPFRRQPRPGHRRTRETLRRGRAKISRRARRRCARSRRCRCPRRCRFIATASC